MKQFYDQTYRNALGKMVKPYGVKVGQADFCHLNCRAWMAINR
jgi:hypothetical protein